MRSQIGWIVALVVLGIVHWPLAQQIATPTAGPFSNVQTILELLKVFLPTSAFVTALYALYSNDRRLRANSDDVLVALILFLVADILVAFSLFIAYFFSWLVVAQIILAYFALEVYAVSFVVLFWLGFVQTYNQLYNLRTDKALKYFKPIRFMREYLGRYKHYELTVESRSPGLKNFSSLKDCFADEEIARLARGATVLITGVATEKALHFLLDVICERLCQGETANYVSADRHPIEVWDLLKQRLGSGFSKHSDLVFIDAYTPSFGFTDDIHRDSTRRLDADGVSCVSARTFAGLHTATARAFNLIKRREQQRDRKSRRPMMMVYAYTSALCDFEGIEQFRIFWRHVIPAERRYGIMTFILEDDHSGSDVLDPLRQRADFVLAYRNKSESHEGAPSLVREK